MEKLLLPAYRVKMPNANLSSRFVQTIVVVPPKVLPMDVYNALLSGGQVESIHHGWISNKGKYYTAEEAMHWADENNLLDRRVRVLGLEDYQGAW